MIIKDKYILTEKLLGAGSFSKVYLGELINENYEPIDKVAIKIIDWNVLETKSCSSKIKKSVMEEIRCMKKLSNDNIVKLIDVEHSGTFTYIILEHCMGGDLQNFIKLYNSFWLNSHPFKK